MSVVAERSDVERIGELKSKVMADGIAFFELSSRQELVEFSTGFGDLVMHRDADPDAVTVVRHVPAVAGEDGFAGLSAGPLLPHTDGSGNSMVPRYITLWCQANEGVGGECAMADGEAVVEDLQRTSPWVVEALSKPNAAIYRSGHEQYSGPAITQDPRGRWHFRLRLDSNGFFSAETIHAVTRLREAIALRTFTFGLAPGQGYIIDNWRYLHGRLTFSGERVMLRTLIN